MDDLLKLFAWSEESTLPLCIEIVDYFASIKGIWIIFLSFNHGRNGSEPCMNMNLAKLNEVLIVEIIAEGIHSAKVNMVISWFTCNYTYTFCKINDLII